MGDEHVKLVTCSANTTNARKRMHIGNECGINQKITFTGGLVEKEYFLAGPTQLFLVLMVSVVTSKET